MEPHRQLSEDNLRTIGKLLGLAIGNKEYQHTRDLRKAAVMFYSINELGYLFTSDHVNKLMELVDDVYSEKMKKILGNMADAYYELVVGQDNPENKFYIITEGKLNSSKN